MRARPLGGRRRLSMAFPRPCRPRSRRTAGRNVRWSMRGAQRRALSALRRQPRRSWKSEAARALRGCGLPTCIFALRCLPSKSACKVVARLTAQSLL